MMDRAKPSDHARDSYSLQSNVFTMSTGHSRGPTHGTTSSSHPIAAGVEGGAEVNSRERARRVFKGGT